MQKRYRLKGWVVSFIYLFSISAIILSGVLLNKTLKNSVYSDDFLSYVYKGLFDEEVMVMNYDNSQITKPFDNEELSIIKSFYDKDSDEETQEKSLIFYQNTYMPNTGILYGSNDVFNVLSVLDGTIESIIADEVMGNIITIKHSNNLSTIYQCLNEVYVSVGDNIKQGEKIGTSGMNKIDSSSDNMLLFEVIYNGEYLNPNTFYELDINELN